MSNHSHGVAAPGLPTSIDFEGVSLTVIDHNGKPWLTGPQISGALGLKSTDAVSRIYRRNADEFSSEMTETVNLTVSGNLQTETRIFSPRGAHLIAMFARTERARAFRRWVLDVLEGLEAPQEPGAWPAPPPRPLPPETRALIEALAREKTEAELRELVDAMESVARTTRDLGGNVTEGDLRRLFLSRKPSGKGRSRPLTPPMRIEIDLCAPRALDPEVTWAVIAEWLPTARCAIDPATARACGLIHRNGGWVGDVYLGGGWFRSVRFEPIPRGLVIGGDLITAMRMSVSPDYRTEVVA